MNYGHFDDSAREYVIERPDTPSSWSNYLGSTEYGAIITNNAGGYSFYKSAAQGRFLRLRFNSIPMDQPGRYFYLRDNDSSDFWSSSWQPVGKPLDQYQSTCRHGTAYTIITSKYSEIETETTYFVPLGQNFEYWRLRITNQSKKPRRISVFTYCEFASNWSTAQDLGNTQYSQYIVKSFRESNRLQIAINDHLPIDPCDFQNNDQSRWAWMALIGAPVVGGDSDRETFLGRYRSYHNPSVVEHGKCTNSNAFCGNACGSMQTDVNLEPGESRELLVLLGVGKINIDGKKAIAQFGNCEQATAELEKLKHYWHSNLEGFHAETPDEDLDHMLNVWNPYNCLITYSWSRAASLVYNGERDGLGYRDTIQDILGVLPLIPEIAKGRLELMITGQLHTGGAMPVVKPFSHRPGHELPPQSYRSDDCLWLFNTVPAYVAETGDLAFYKKVLPFADQGEATVMGHLRRALEFNIERSGKNGLPCGLEADWNDCLKLGYYGESLFVAFQLWYGLSVYAKIAERFGEEAEVNWANEQQQLLKGKIQACTWDGEWFIWAIGEDGTVYGSKNSNEGSIYLNTQVWAVISGAASPDQARQSMASVREQLATPYGVMLCSPPFKKTDVTVMRAVLFNEGVKENAGIFNHTQGWAVMAECMLGHGDQAYEYYRSFMPSAYNDRAEIRQSEPYVHCQSTQSKFSPNNGMSRLAWLSGTASWAYYSATHYILGIRPEVDGLIVDPCIPRKWDGFKVQRRFRNKELHIEVTNPKQVSRGVVSIMVDGREIEPGVISNSILKDGSVIQVTMGVPEEAQKAKPSRLFSTAIS